MQVCLERNSCKKTIDMRCLWRSKDDETANKEVKLGRSHGSRRRVCRQPEKINVNQASLGPIDTMHMFVSIAVCDIFQNICPQRLSGQSERL